MKELKLGGKLGLVALVDDEDFERVSARLWHPNKSIIKSSGKISTYYAMDIPGNFLHRFILGITDGKIKVDHRDRNGLNNQKSNLRTGSQSQNLANQVKPRNNTSGFKGAYKARKGYIAIISLNDKLRHLGTFSTAEEAGMAYDKAALEQWGEFASLNFPEKIATL